MVTHSHTRERRKRNTGALSDGYGERNSDIEEQKEKGRERRKKRKIDLGPIMQSENMRPILMPSIAYSNHLYHTTNKINILGMGKN